MLGEAFTVRVGTQLACGGFAVVHVRVSRSEGALRFEAEERPGWRGGAHGPDVPGHAMPRELREATFDGARAAFARAGVDRGYRFLIHDATVHPVDGSRARFREAGYEAVKLALEVG